MSQFDYDNFWVLNICYDFCLVCNCLKLRKKSHWSKFFDQLLYSRKYSKIFSPWPIGICLGKCHETYIQHSNFIITKLADEMHRTFALLLSNHRTDVNSPFQNCSVIGEIYYLMVRISVVLRHTINRMMVQQKESNTDRNNFEDSY